MKVLFATIAAVSWLAPQTDDTASSGTAPDPLTAALAKAREAHRYVVVAVFGDECEQSRRYQEEILVDEGVAEWLKLRAVFTAVSLDDAAGKSFAAKHRILEPPAILVLSNDGGELGRQLGVAEPAALLMKLKQSIQSNRIVGNGAYKPWAGEDVVLEAARRAIRLTADGKFDEALAEYNWCLDHRVARSPLFPARYLPEVIEGLAGLGSQHPPARDELLKRIEQAGRDIETAERPDAYTIYLIKHGNAALDRESHTVEVFRNLKRSRAGDTVTEMYARLNFEALLNARMYEDLEYAVAEPAHVDTYLNDAKNARRPLFEVRRVLAAWYELLLAYGREREARNVVSL